MNEMDIKFKDGLALALGLMIAGTGIAQAQSLILPNFLCTMTNKLDKFNWPGSEQDAFTPSQQAIFMICNSDNVYNGDRIKAVWIADHTGGYWPEHFTIGVIGKRFVKRPNQDETFEANLSMAKPCNGWPTGVYHVQLYVNEVEDKSYTFQVR